MSGNKTRTETTSADSIQLGFEYQYLYFIVRLLELKAHQEVGYEAQDDVHIISYDNKTTIMVQLKHTIEKAASGDQANLTALSADLWKTLSNWSKLICDPSENRVTMEAQRLFMSNASFELVSNRKTCNNEVIKAISDLQKGAATATEVREVLLGLHEKTRDTTIKTYISTVLGLDSSVFCFFMRKINFITTPSMLFDQIRAGIMDKMIAVEYVDDVLGDLYLQLKEDFFSKVQSGRHQIITYDEWISKYRSVFDSKRRTLLPLRCYEPLLPDHLDKQPFVKELVEIGAIEADAAGISEIAELTRHYLNIQMQLEDWRSDGKLTLSDTQRFHSEAALCWRKIHLPYHRTTNGMVAKDLENALKCFDDVMKEKLNLLSTELGVSLSNGEFIKLANEERIGWKHSWKARYYENGNELTKTQ